MRQLLIASLALLLSLSALATQALKPYYFSADTVTYQSKQHRVIYVGHVKVNQGTTHLTGDKLTVYLTPANQIIKFIDIGTPATYVGKNKTQANLVHAHAKTITYEARKKLLLLDKNAFVKQNYNTIHAGHIIYDRKTGVIHTRGGKRQPITHIILQPTTMKSH